jgi:hypothetical protein
MKCHERCVTHLKIRSGYLRQEKPALKSARALANALSLSGKSIGETNLPWSSEVLDRVGTHASPLGWLQRANAFKPAKDIK